METPWTITFVDLPREIHSLFAIALDTATLISLSYVNSYFGGVCREIPCRIDFSEIQMPPSVLATLLRRFPSAMEISLAGCDVDDALIAGLAQFRNLRRLDLSFTLGLSLNSVLAIAQFPVLEGLNLSRTYYTDMDTGYLRLLSSAPALRTLTYDCSNLSSDASAITPPLLRQLVSRSNYHESGEFVPSGIEHLDLSGSAYLEAAFTTRPALGVVLERAGPALRSLVVDNALTTADASLAIIARHCPRLETLSLRGAQGLSMVGLEALRCLSRLKLVDARACRDAEQVAAAVGAAPPLAFELRLFGLTPVALSWMLYQGLGDMQRPSGVPLSAPQTPVLLVFSLLSGFTATAVVDMDEPLRRALVRCVPALPVRRRCCVLCARIHHVCV
jgi:hypothetical protein